MSQFAGHKLTSALLDRLSIDRAIEHADQAIVVCSVDEDAFPHPAMLSSLEIVAIDASNIRLAAHSTSRTVRNLKANGKLTLILADQDGVFYIKGTVPAISTMPAAPDQVRLNMRVDSLFEDNPAAYEHARLTSGIRVQRATLDRARAQAVLHNLVADGE